MSKKKSEKEGKEKKHTAKKPPVKPAVPAVEDGETAAVEAKPAAKPKVRKSPAAPRKKTVKALAITGDDIALRAYFIAERRQKMGWHGDSTGDWVEAERQLKAEAARKK